MGRKKAYYMSKYLSGAWLKMFKPSSSKKSLFYSQEDINEKYNCYLGKMGLGSIDNINQKGYIEMVKALPGDDKHKEILTKTVEKCAKSTQEGKVSFSKFTACALPMLETSCGV